MPFVVYDGESIDYKEVDGSRYVGEEGRHGIGRGIYLPRDGVESFLATLNKSRSVSLVDVLLLLFSSKIYLMLPLLTFFQLLPLNLVFLLH